MTPRVTDVSFTIAAPGLQARGLLGWATFVLDGSYRVDCATLRRTRSRRLALSFPVRGRGASQRVVLRVLDERVRASIETQVISALARDGRLSA